MSLMKRSILKAISLVLIILCTSTGTTFGISEKQAREEVVKYMEYMANIAWSPKRTIKYWNDKYGDVYKEGKLYKGIPYTQFGRYTSPSRFIINSEFKNGILVYTVPYKDGEYYGTDCSWAITLAWRIVDPMFSLNDTMDMFSNLEKNQGGICKVGQYAIITGNEASTKEVNKNNGKETMFKAYQNLKPGDAVLKNTYNQVTDRFTGHIRLVKEIDRKNKSITIIEQIGVNDNGILMEDGISSWKNGFKISFNELFEDGYIPVGNEKLLSLGKLQKEEEKQKYPVNAVVGKKQ